MTSRNSSYGRKKLVLFSGRNAISARPFAPQPRAKLDKTTPRRGSGNARLRSYGTKSMDMLNDHCGVDRDSRGVVRLTICNAGSLNILGTPVITGVGDGLKKLSSDQGIRVLVLAGQSEKSMIGGADIKEMATLDQKSAEKFITGLRDLCEAVRAFPGPVRS